MTTIIRISFQHTLRCLASLLKSFYLKRTNLKEQIRNTTNENLTINEIVKSVYSPNIK